MQPREPAGTPDPDPATAARARLATELRHHGRGLSRTVQDAFARVPRHVFVPEVGPAASYRDEALVIKCGADGLPVSSSSQPAMMAIMLDQLGLRPGHRVLEIGTGSGYNAAVMSEVVGESGQVVSIDIDPELVARARASLASAGYDSVEVTCADGGFGDPDGAPFDRIIVTAGAWDIAPAWLSQLGPGGLLVLPVSIRGIQLSVALQSSGGADDAAGHTGAGSQWRSTSAWRCGFVRMLGAFAGPEEVLRLEEPSPLYAQMADGSPVDSRALQAALAGPAADEQLAPWPAGLADIADLDLWLTLTAPELDRVTLLAAPGGWFGLASLLPLGGLVADALDADRLGVALVLPSGLGQEGVAARSRPGILLRGLGPGGSRLAGYLAGRAGLWADLGRPGVRDLLLTVRPEWPASGGEPAPAAARPGTLTLARPSVTIEVSWLR